MNQQRVDVACLIHGELYNWNYVDRLYSMVRKNFSCDLSFHVFTEKKRFVPEHMIRHNLQDWPGISGARKAWWYKLQMFNSEHFSGRLLYLDLDVVITRNLDWMLDLDKKMFWTVRDFKYLWRPTWKGMNSSVMLWDTTKWSNIWEEFQNRNLAATIRQFHGDQDFLNSMMTEKHLRFFDEKYIKSWRWQIKDGGFDMKIRTYNQPNAGSIIDPDTAVVVFHGSPKPHEINDPIVQQLWGNL